MESESTEDFYSRAFPQSMYRNGNKANDRPLLELELVPIGPLSDSEWTEIREKIESKFAEMINLLLPQTLHDSATKTTLINEIMQRLGYHG